jgi:hypothetical protein
MIPEARRREDREDPISSIPTRLACPDSWSSNERTASLVELPGLAAFVHSVPFGPGDAGGDVHYLSVCPDCIFSRIALADVSGHGESVMAFGEKLRDLMRRYLSSLSPKGLMQDLNEAVRRELDSVHYATMVRKYCCKRCSGNAHKERQRAHKIKPEGLAPSKNKRRPRRT